MSETTDAEIADGRPWKAWMHDIRCALGAEKHVDARSFFSLARMNGAPEADILRWATRRAEENESA